MKGQGTYKTFENLIAIPTFCDLEGQSTSNKPIKVDYLPFI
jgi:hypothetical protein